MEMKMTSVAMFLVFVVGARAQCDGSCQQTSDSCSAGYVSGLCQGASNIECCKETTQYCPGQCQSNIEGMTCAGTYQAGLCPGASDVQCCQGVQPFADRYWNCADVACTQTVASGSSQPNYECAEFVARALAAGGWISGLSGLEAQSSYDPYEYNGQSYDLLWVSNIQGGPLGLREFLLAKGWSGDASSSIVAGSAVMVSGSGGSYGHVALGVGDNVCDAHNNARYHATSCNTFYIVDQVLNPPSANECSENCVEYPVSNETYVPHYKRLAALGVNETQSPWG